MNNQNKEKDLKEIKNKKKENIEAIFLDIDDTLYSTSIFSHKARLKSVETMIKLGLRMPLDTLYKELLEVIEEFSSNYQYHFDKLLLRLPPKTYEGINKAILIAGAVNSYHDSKHELLKPYEDAIKFLEYISKFPIIIGIISDGLEIKQAEKLLRLGIYKYLDPQAIFISDQIGIGKSNPKIFKYVCSQFNLDPKKVIYIGDNPIKDIDNANKIGLITIRIKKDEGKYSNKESKTSPRFCAKDFYEIINFLKENFLPFN